VKPPPFDYAAPESVSEAIALLSDPDREAMIIAGGQSLMPMLNMRLARPELLVDLRHIGDLDYIREAGDRLLIGAMTTKRTVEDSTLVRDKVPLLHASTLQVGHPQIRNRGTVGGSMAQADPAAEYPAVAIALGAEMRIAGPGGERTVPAADFFVTYLTTALEEDDILVEVGFPVRAERTGWSFGEVSRRHGDFALAGVVTTITLDPVGTCQDARIVLFAVTSSPLRVQAAEDVLRGERPTPEVMSRAADAVASALADPLADSHASADYRRNLARTLTERGLGEAVERA